MKDYDKMGHTARIRYKGGIKGEPAVDECGDEPLDVILGTGRLPRGIEDAICEMEVGEQRTVEIPPELGFGDYDSRRVNWYPRTMVERGYERKVGDMLAWTKPEENVRMPAWVIDATEDTLRIDLNHPFAGKTLEYWVELVDLQ